MKKQSLILLILFGILVGNCNNSKEQKQQDNISKLFALNAVTSLFAPKPNPQTVYTLNPVDANSTTQTVPFTKMELVSCSHSGGSNIPLGIYQSLGLVRMNVQEGEKVIFNSVTSDLDVAIGIVSPIFPKLLKGEPNLTYDFCNPSVYTDSAQISDVSYIGTGNLGTYSFKVAGKYFLFLQSGENSPTDITVRKE